jgi:hypothetical protein
MALADTRRVSRPVLRQIEETDHYHTHDAHGLRCRNIMAASEPVLMTDQSVIPPAIVRQPTARRALTESDVPIKNSTKIMPRWANSERFGAHPETIGT